MSKKFDVKVHTTDPSVSAIMVVQAVSKDEAKRLAIAKVKSDHPHVEIRSVVAEPSLIVPEPKS